MISNKTNLAMIHETLEKLAHDGIADLKASLERLFNQLMLAEREDYIQAAPYERTDRRIDHCNGFKDKKLLTRGGELHLRVPQTRSSDFYPSCLNRGEKTEQALKVTLAEAYVQGVSTRKMKTLTEQLCGKEISSSQVSRFAATLDEEVKQFKTRSLGSYCYLFLDAQYEKVRHEGSVRSLAVLKAVGITDDGTREVLSVSTSLSEAEIHWRNFLIDLQKRGLRGVKLIISDDHAGLRQARNAVFPAIKWQRCLFHMAQNAGSYAPSVPMRSEIGNAVREIYQAADKNEAQTRMKKVIERYSEKASAFCDWLEENFEEGLTFFDFPKSHRQKIRTNNMLERFNREQKRRTRVVGLFPSVQSCDRLITTIAMRTHEEWASNSRRYLSTQN